MANFSDIQPAPNDNVGDSGWYVRSNDIQLINCRVEDLTNGGSAFKLFERSANGGPYGRNIELKSVSGSDMTGHLIWIHKSSVANATTLYDDYVLDSVASGLFRTGSTPTVAPAAEFCEMTWSGIGGDKYFEGLSCQNPAANQLPVAIATANTVTGTAPLAINFDGSSSTDPDGDALTYAWSFGDGQTASGVSASHTYSTAGSYIATLQVSDGSGGSQTDTLTITVTTEGGDPIDPVDPIDPIDGDTVAFDDFDSESTTGGAGWASPWTATTGQFRIDDQYSRGPSAGALNPRKRATFERTVDLSGETENLQLQFYWLREGGKYDNNVEYTQLEIFDGTWQTLRIWDFEESSTTWQLASFDLSSYNRIAGFKIRFANYANANSEEIFIEDLRITRTGDSGGGDPIDPIDPIDPENTPPVADATASPLSGIAPLTVFFDAGASSDADSDPLTYAWDFGDGDSSTLESPSHVFTSAGSYSVTLTVNDGNGGTDTETLTITVTPGSNDAPTAVAAATAGIGGAPLSYQFTGSGSTDPEGDALTYAWDFGDGQSASGETVTHDFPVAGTYTVSLTVTDTVGNTDSTSLQVSPQFANPGDAATVAEHDFDNEALNGGTGWVGTAWIADNANFKVDDEYNIGVAALNLDTTTGGERTVDLSSQSDVYLSFDLLMETGKLDPGEFFTVRVFDGVWHQIAQFSGADATGNWEDQLFSLAAFDMVADFKIRFELIADNGGEEVFVDNVRVFVDAPTVNQDPVATATASRRAGNAPLSITFDASDSFDVNGDALSYFWDFGSASATGVSPAYTFTSLGKQTVTLTVEDGRNGEDTFELEVEVTPLGTNLSPVAEVSASITDGVAPLTVSFDSDGSFDPEAEPMTYLWNFGDGNTATGTTALHTFTSPGRYAAELTVIDEQGAHGRAQVLINVRSSASSTIVGDYRIDPAPNYLAWAVEAFGEATVRNQGLRDTVWGPTADSDGDGRSNLVERAFASVGDETDAPMMQVGYDATSDRLQVEMHMIAAETSGIVYDLMGSADLTGDWELIPEDQYSLRTLEADALGDGRYKRVLLEPTNGALDRFQFFRFSLARSESAAAENPVILPIVVDDPWSELLPDLPAAPDDPNNIYRAGLYRENSAGVRVPHAMPQPNPVWGNRLVVSNAADDDRPAIQAAIDAAQPGDEVFLPNGVYDLRSATDSQGAILLRSFINLRGESREGVILRVWTSANAAISALAGDQNIQDIVLSGMSIEKPNGNLENIILFARNSDSGSGVGARFYIRDVRIKNFYRRGFRMYRIREAVIENCIASDTVGEQDGYGFEAFSDSSDPLDETKWIVFRDSQAPARTCATASLCRTTSTAASSRDARPMITTTAQSSCTTPVRS